MFCVIFLCHTLYIKLIISAGLLIFHRSQIYKSAYHIFSAKVYTKTKISNEIESSKMDRSENGKRFYYFVHFLFFLNDQDYVCVKIITCTYPRIGMI